MRSIPLLFAVVFLGGLLSSEASADPTFHLLVESNDDRPAGSELFAASYNSYADLLAGNIASSSFLQENVASDFSVGGLTYDGSQFHLLVESNDDRPAGSELFAASYNSYADLLAGNIASSSFLQENVASDFSVGGLAFDGSQFHLLVESNDDRPAGSELFVASYNSYADLLAGNIASSSFVQENVASDFGVGGFVGVPPAGSVPEPSAIALLGLCAALIFRARQKT